jgi:hypothetical protein
VAEIGLQRPSVMPPICECVPAGMPKHVRVGLERQLGDLSSSLDHAGEAGGRKWSTALGSKHERRLGLLLTMQPPEGAQFVAKDRMGARSGPSAFARTGGGIGRQWNLGDQGMPGDDRVAPGRRTHRRPRLVTAGAILVAGPVCHPNADLQRVLSPARWQVRPH